MKGDDEDAEDPRLISELADALGAEGELIPSSEAEVAAALRDGVAFEGELPASLTRFRDDAPAAPRSTKVVSLAEVRRNRGSLFSYASTFALGAAAAAVALFALRGPPPSMPDPLNAQAQGTGLVPPTPTERTSIPPVGSCDASCCAGVQCPKAQGDLGRCASERRCVACADPGDVTSYALRVGNLQPAKGIESDQLAGVDLCVRVASAPWECAPATSVQPGGRRLTTLASRADIASGVSFELRFRGKTAKLAGYRESIRMGSSVLCRGVGVLLASEKQEDFGSLSLFFDDPYYVELARGGELETLRALRNRFEFTDVVPALREVSGGEKPSFALVVGPLDSPTAERLRWALLEHQVPAKVTLGQDLSGAPKPLP